MRNKKAFGEATERFFALFDKNLAFRIAELNAIAMIIENARVIEILPAAVATQLFPAFIAALPPSKARV